jgi:hypothetical protein
MSYWGARVTMKRSTISPAVTQRQWDRMDVPLSRFCAWYSRERIPRMFREGGPRDAPWAANAPSTIRAKGHDRPLIGRRGLVPGSLGHSIRVYVSRVGPGRFALSQASSKFYARFHHEGRPGRYHARRIFGFTRYDLQVRNQYVREHLRLKSGARLFATSGGGG